MYTIYESFSIEIGCQSLSLIISRIYSNIKFSESTENGAVVTVATDSLTNNKLARQPLEIHIIKLVLKKIELNDK